MSARKKWAISIAFLILEWVLAMLVGQRHPEMKWGIIAAAVAGAELMKVVLFRCPHCGRYLGRSFWPGRRCPYCNEIID